MKNKILFTLSTHGDEAFTVPIFKKIEKKFPKEKYNYDWIIANEKAYEKNVRFVDVDLNRSAPGNPKSKLYEEQRAAELVEMSKNYSVVIDIHGTNSDIGLVKIIPLSTFTNLYLASLIPGNNVVWYSKNSLKKGPLVQHMHCPAIEIECGPKESIKTANLLYKTVTSYLDLRNNSNYSDLLTKIKNQNYFCVYGKESLSNLKVKDFEKVTSKEGDYYPFLTVNGYKTNSFYKLKKIDFSELFIY